MIRLPAYLDTFSSKADKTAGIRFSTNELADEDFTVLRQHQGLFGWLIFSEEQVQEKDIPKEIMEDKTKTPSKRLRSTLYRYYIQEKGKKENFETWYRKWMEAEIDRVKEKLHD